MTQEEMRAPPGFEDLVAERPPYAQSYRVVRAVRFPTLEVGGEPFKFPQQLGFGSVAPVDTTVTRVEMRDLPENFYAAQVEHDVMLPIPHRDEAGVIRQSTTLHYSFRLYHNPVAHSILFAGSKRPVTSFVAECRRRGLADLELWDVDFDRLRANVGGNVAFRGAWLRTDQPNMRAAAIYGDNVNDAEHFQAMLEEGAEMSTATITDYRLTPPMILMITREGTIVLQRRLVDAGTRIPNIQREIAYVLEISTTLLAGALVPHVRRRRRPSTPEAELAEPLDPSGQEDQEPPDQT